MVCQVYKYLHTIPDRRLKATLPGAMDTERLFRDSGAVFNPTEIHMHPAAAPRRDTQAWKAQVWASFGIAVTLAGTGLAWLPGDDIHRVFMVMGYFFTL